MKKTSLILAGLSLTAAIAQAATVSSVANGGYTADATWSDAAAPTAGNDYVIQNDVSFTGDGTNVQLAGDSVTVNTGGWLRISAANQGGPDNYYVNNLTLNGGNLNLRSSSQYYRDMHLKNSLSVTADSQLRIGYGGENFNVDAYLDGGLTGSGNITLNGNANSVAILHATVADSGFSGDWYAASIDTGLLRISADAANSLGTGAVELALRASLNVNAAGGIDSLSGISLLTASSQLLLTNAWNNESAFLIITDGTLDLGTGDSVIGAFSIGGNDLASGTYDADALTSLGYGGIYTGTGTITVIPEPGTSMLALMGGFAFILRRKRA